MAGVFCRSKAVSAGAALTVIRMPTLVALRMTVDSAGGCLTVSVISIRIMLCRRSPPASEAEPW